MRSDNSTIRFPRNFIRSALAGAALAGLAACGGGNERPAADIAASQVTSIGVNSYLWRATLETLAFMPLTQADSAGGVVVTDSLTRSLGLSGLAYQSVTTTPPALSEDEFAALRAMCEDDEDVEEFDFF